MDASELASQVATMALEPLNGQEDDAPFQGSSLNSTTSIEQPQHVTTSSPNATPASQFSPAFGLPGFPTAGLPPVHSPTPTSVLRSFTTPASPEEIAIDSKLVGFNKLGYPVRRGVSLCHHWRLKGHCGTGRECKFTHPDNVVTVAQAAARGSESTTKVPSSKVAGDGEYSPELESRAIAVLNSWVRRQPGGKMYLSSIGEFRKTYPEFNPVFAKHKTRHLVDKYPQRFKVEQGDALNKLWLIGLPVDSTWEVARESENGQMKELVHKNQDSTTSVNHVAAGEEEKVSVKQEHKESKAAKVAEWLRKGTFDDQGVKLFAQFVSRHPRKVIPPPDIGRFYQEYREYEYMFTRRLPELVKVYPDLFVLTMVGNIAHVALKNPSTSFSDKTPSPAVATTMTHRESSTGPHAPVQTQSREAHDDVVKQAFYELGRFIREEVPSHRLSAVEMAPFYRKYPEYKKVFHGKFKELARMYPDALRVEPGEPGGLVFFARDAGPQSGKGFPSSMVTETSKVVATKQSALGVPSSSDAKEIRAILKSWLPIDNILVEVQGDEVTGEISVVTLFSTSGNTLLVDFSPSSMKGATTSETLLMQSGLGDMLVDVLLPKACLDATRFAFMVFRTWKITVAGVFDLKTSGEVLYPEQAPMTLVKLVSLYHIHVSTPLNHQLVLVDWSKRPFGFKFATWIRMQKTLLPIVQERIIAETMEKNLFDTCVQASNTAVLEGIKLAVHLQTAASRSTPTTTTTTKSTTKKEPTGQAAGTAVGKTKKAAATIGKVTSKAELQQKLKDRQEELKKRNLPMNACYSFYVATPGVCRTPFCKFRHGPVEGDHSVTTSS